MVVHDMRSPTVSIKLGLDRTKIVLDEIMMIISQLEKNISNKPIQQEESQIPLDVSEPQSIRHLTRALEKNISIIENECLHQTKDIKDTIQSLLNKVEIEPSQELEEEEEKNDLNDDEGEFEDDQVDELHGVQNHHLN